MSTDMQEAYTKDQAVIESNGNFEYVDNDEPIPAKEDTQPTEEPKPVDISEL
jgi:hypothetical protein